MAALCDPADRGVCVCVCVTYHVHLHMQEEGIVVKDTTSPWRMNDRGTAWQKIKPGAQLKLQSGTQHVRT